MHAVPRGGVANMQAQGPADSVPADSVVEQMARARCTQEQACGVVGFERPFATKEECLQFMRGSIQDSLDVPSCSLGIDQFALGDCVAAIDHETCGDGVAVLRRAHLCRADVLCVR
ncbi:MAG: DUF6184 family natural product biosynthesis lipoprotein [Polyangiaceae bacterium]